jgi:uncharacterized protein YprB with RNaseH-like and TPR domain
MSQRGIQPRAAAAAEEEEEEECAWRHCDLLHHARRLWKRHLPDCRLQTLERFICGRRRVGDISGRDIPLTYHDYVRTGDPTRVHSLLHHNAIDLVTLVQLSLHIASWGGTDLTHRSG